MKTAISTLIMLALYFPIQITAQTSAENEIIVEDIRKVMSKGYVSGFKVIIPKANKKDVEKEWSKDVRQNTNYKVEKNNNELVIQETNLKTISSKPMNVYAIVNPHPQHVEMNVFFEIDSQFIDMQTDETASLAAQMFLRNFARDMYRDEMKDEVKDEEKKLKSLEKDLKKLIKANENLHKEINSEEREINDLQREIATSDLDQERIREQIQLQKDELLRLRNQGAGEAVTDEAEDKLKDFEKDLKKLQKDEDKLHRSINKCEAKIREYKREIADNNQVIELKRAEITRQREVLLKKERKKESIK